MSNQSSGQWQAGDILLDQYRVVGVLGQTELGEVYRVRHLGWNIDLAAYSFKSAAIESLEQMEAEPRWPCPDCGTMYDARSFVERIAAADRRFDEAFRAIEQAEQRSGSAGA